MSFERETTTLTCRMASTLFEPLGVLVVRTEDEELELGPATNRYDRQVDELLDPFLGGLLLMPTRRVPASGSLGRSK